MKNTLHSKNLPLVATGIPTPFCNPKTKTTSSLKGLLALVLMVLLVGNVEFSFGQTNPAAFALSGGSFTFASQTATSTTYPTNMQGWNNASTPVSLIVISSTADISLTASASGSTAGIGNLGANGFNFLNTTNANTAGAIAVSLNATGRSNILVTWTAADQSSVTTSIRQTNLTLQYRLGTTGDFTTIASSTYTSSNTGQAAAQTFSSIALPSACNNQAVVQIRWLYYESASQSGARDGIRLDDITVSSTAAGSTVTFNASSGSITTTTQTAATATNLTSASTLGLSRTGYSFGGWATSAANATAGTVAYADGASYPFSSSTTLYAIWTANNNTITYYANTGSGTAMTNQTIATAASANLTSNTYTKAGYTFAGWNTLADGTGTSYLDGASYTMGTANVTLYAKWTANNNTITFDANTGTGTAMTNQTIATAASANLTSNTYTKAGYTFAGWNTLADGTGTSYANSASYTMGSANVTLYAKWTINNNTIIWVGTNGIWSEPSNWSPSAPSLSNIIIISSGNPVLDTDFTIGSSGSLTISGSGGLTINPGKTITIAGTADFGGQLVTIKSDGNGTGAIGQVTGTLTGAINVTVERYIPNKRSWRALTAPLKGSISDASIFSQWQNNGNSSDTTTGVELWGPAGDATPSSINTGLAVGPFNSILQYVAGAWSPVIDTNATKLFTTSGNNAFMVFPTGGYGSGLISSTAFPLATTLKATGQLIIGDVPYVGLPSTSHTLIGNPYASPISPLALLTTNTTFDNNLWVWDPNVAGDLNVGVYNLFTKTGATTGTYTNTTGPSYSSNPTPDIQSGQAFFVKAASGTQTLTISESFKTGTVSSNAVFRDAAPAELLRLGLYKQTNNQWSGRDGAIALFFTDADANQTANKMANGSENVAFTNNSELFASEHHLPLVASDVLNVRVWNTTAGANYKLKINTEEFTTTNLDATLEDLFTNSRTPIALDGSAIEYPFAVTTEAASTGNRFRIVFQNAVLGMNNPKANGITILPNPITGDAFQVNLGTLAMGMYTYSICNALGQEVENGSINNVAQNTNYAVKFKNNTAAGMYIMKVTGTDTTVFTAKLIKK